MSLRTITRSKPFYVVAGATDIAVKSLREVSARVPAVRIRLDRSDVEKAVAALQAEAVALPGKAQAAASGLPGKAQAAASGLPGKTQAAASGLADVAAGRADAVYGDLLTRGRDVVGRIRRQKSTQDLQASAATTVRRTKAASTTAKKQAAGTKTAAKSATTSARKTASTAAKATTDAADKLGN